MHLSNFINSVNLTAVQDHGAAQQAAEHGAEHGESIGEVVLHHVLDSNEWDLLFTKIHLPEIHLWGIDFTISKHVVMMWIASLLAIIVFKFGMKWKNQIPVGLTRFFEPLILFVRDEIVYLNFGKKEGKKFVPFFLTVFFFILFMNMIGMVPLMGAASSNFSVTAGLAGVSFLLMHLAGMFHYGPIKHFKNFVPSGLPWWLVPVIFPIELIGTVGRSVALCIRLFAAMTAGHIVIMSFIGLIIVLNSVYVSLFSIPVAIFISLLEVFFAFLQAYIFTFLTSLFVSMTYHVDH